MDEGSVLRSRAPGQVSAGADGIAQCLPGELGRKEHVPRRIDDHHRVVAAFREQVRQRERFADGELSLLDQIGQEARPLLFRAAERAPGLRSGLEVAQHFHVRGPEEGLGLLAEREVHGGDGAGERIDALLDLLFGAVACGIDEKGALGDRRQLHVAASWSDFYSKATTAVLPKAASLGSTACTVDRAGGAPVKNFAYTSFIAWKSPMLRRNTVVFTARSRLVPAAASTAARFFSTRSVCALTSPSTTLFVAGSRAIWPAAKTKPPALIACEYGPAAGGASFVRTGCFAAGDEMSSANEANNPSGFFTATPPSGRAASHIRAIRVLPCRARRRIAT